MRKGEYIILDDDDMNRTHRDLNIPIKKISPIMFSDFDLIRSSELVIFVKKGTTQYKILKSRYFSP